MKKRNLWTCLGLVCLLLLTGCGGGDADKGDTGSATDEYKPYPLDDTDSALMGAMDRAHAEFDGLDQDAAVQKLEATFMELTTGKDGKLVVKESSGNMRTFYLGADLPEKEWKRWEDPSKQGSKITVEWRVADRADGKGGKMTVEEAVGIDNE